MSLRIALLSTLLIPAVAHAAPETYTLDPNHTNIVWKVSHFGYSSPSGRFGIKEGTLVLDEAAPANSSVNVMIDVAGLTTGIKKFDEHILSPDFLNAKKNPTATFKSTKVVLDDDKDEAKVHGDLTLNGVTKPVVMDVELNKIAYNEMFKKKVAGFSAEIDLKRSDFGITQGVPDVGDIVKIEIEAEASPVAAAKK